jgi:uncharacterized DUF497 family protein
MISPQWNFEDVRLVIGSTKVDYDLNKEFTNRRNHGYSLTSAVHFFTRLLLPLQQPPFITSDAKHPEERRHTHMTVDDEGKVVFFVTAMRADETVRVISLRRTHVTERNVFLALTGFKEVDHT